jgi:lipopolysaccharide transport system permease protein
MRTAILSQCHGKSRVTESFIEFFCLHRRNLLFNLVNRNFKVKFKGSALGYFWTLVIPLSQVLVFYFVYQVILKIPVPNYLAFIVTGILPWVFFASTIIESLESLVSGQNLLTHMPMPLQAFPAASVATNFISFVLSWPILFGAIFWSGIRPDWLMLLFVPLSLLLFIFTYSLSFILASLFVLFRDLKHIFGIVVQLWMYSTPVLYSANLIPQNFRWILYANPLSGFFVGARDVLIGGQLPDPLLMATFVGWTFVMFAAANILRLSVGPRLVEKI